MSVIEFITQCQRHATLGTRAQSVPARADQLDLPSGGMIFFPL